jgi:DNA-binding transcriptional LysR family regulator
LTLRHFKIFVTVCDTMNMTAAAKELYMSQSAVSQAISELEKYYNIRLFERLSRKLYKTGGGEKLLSYARHIIRMTAEVESDMHSFQENGFIRIGASVTVGAYVLPKLVIDYKQIYSGTDIKVFEDNTEKVENMILGDQIDIGLVEGEISSQDICQIPFMDDELVLICGKEHRFAGLTNIQASELEKEGFIIREQGSGTRKLFEDVMFANHIKFNVIWTCNNADTIKMAVAEGIGISVISKRAIKSEVESGLINETEIEGIKFNRKFKIIYHKNKYLTKPIKSFLNICQNIK